MYGSPYFNEKHKLWDLLLSLAQNNQLPWMVCGDFNVVLFSNEKQGGKPFDLREVKAIKEAIDQLGFQDLGFTGDPFTWNNN